MREIELNKPIKHVAIIMDGNGRWAKKRGLPRTAGHKAAMDRIIDLFDYCRDYDIKVLSLYAFSTENLKRPKQEIAFLWRYLELFFKREIDTLMKDGTKVVVSGDISKLPEKTQKIVNKAVDQTKNNPNIIWNICLNYGGKQELTRAAKLIAEEVKEGKFKVEDITEEVMENHLYTGGLPNVDLMIRTSGEIRTSNFLPWQIAYAEYVFTPVQFPDFKRKEFVDCLIEYNKRNRRYGGLDDEKNN
ncbi:MAG: di-trans,poly-cis-decaprenylcistransferase [Muribaculaceae bacterium]|nr:di-trans,poly-cis-decaprenylcistransferase [Muribaculaceae bacterium]